MVGLYILLAVIVLVIVAKKLHAHKEEQARLAQAALLGEKLVKAVDKVNNGSTVSTRINNCKKAIKLLEEISILDPKCKVVGNQRSALRKVKALEKVIPIHKALEKVEKYEFKGQKKSALNAILDALYQCKTANVNSDDFRIAELRDNSGTLVSFDYLKRKARSLGWKESCE